MEYITVDTPLQVFNALSSQDDNLTNLRIQATRSFVFDSAKFPSEDIYDNLSKIEIAHPMINFKLEDGFDSLSRRGFYQIVSQIEATTDVIFTTGQKYTAYRAYVLYADDVNTDRYFQFNANIGPLVNADAIIFDLSPTRSKKVLKFPTQEYNRINKRNFLESLINKPFYISLQQRAANDHKQTFWFKLK
jgi:hypothetical protein